MRFLSFMLPAFAFCAVVAATPAPVASLQERAAGPSEVISNLYASVQQHTAVINSTAAGVSTNSPLDAQKAAGQQITEALAAINAAVLQATSQLNALPAAGSSSTLLSTLSTRQAAPGNLQNIVTNLLLDISGALNNVISSLGLTATLSFLGPLVGSLSGLLLSLDRVVDQLLAVVKQLLDGLLIGLSEALAGLQL